MSNLLPLPDTLECQAGVVAAPVLEPYPARHAELGGGLLVRRALPRAGRRLVGPWCFLDHFGPLTFGEGKPMDVAPHPHIGLQTVTWLMAGEALHKDSLGHEQVIRPGQLNLMTAGMGIAHSEETPIEHSGRLHGLQLWVALPDPERHVTARFDHYGELPMAGLGASHVTVLLGALGEVRSPGRTYSELVALDIAADRDGDIDVPIDPRFEHALLLIEGRAALDGRSLDADTLYYLGTGRERLRLTGGTGARIVVLGGEPFGETVLMWWNFVARTPDEIVKARDDWERGRQFGTVHAYEGARIPAPPLTARLRRPG